MKALAKGEEYRLIGKDNQDVTAQVILILPHTNPNQFFLRLKLQR